VRCLERGTNGLFNATSPPNAITMGSLLNDCRTVSGSDARFTWADGKFLEEHEVAAWSDMPVWVPLDGENAESVLPHGGRVHGVDPRLDPAEHARDCARNTEGEREARVGEEKPLQRGEVGARRGGGHFTEQTFEPASHGLLTQEVR